MSKGARRWSEDGRAESTAGAWAAAAVVLALGALGFGVVSQVHVQDLERRIESLEQTSRTPAPTIAEPTALDPVSATDTTSTSVVPVVGPTGGSVPASERAGVEAAFGSVYDGTRPLEERLAMVDDPTGIPDSLQKLRVGPLASAAARLRAVVDQVTFTSSMTATVTYRLSSGSGGEEPQRVGSARRVDGVWKVTRSTVCTDLSDAGAPCAG